MSWNEINYDTKKAYKNEVRDKKVIKNEEIQPAITSKNEIFHFCFVVSFYTSTEIYLVMKPS